MRRLLLLFCFVPWILWGAAIDKKIASKKKELSSTKIEYNKMDKKLSSVAKKIIDAKAKRDALDQKLQGLETRIQSNQSEFDQLNSKQKEVEKELSNLTVEIASKKEKFVALVADKFSMALVLEEMKQPTSESVMLQEVYGVYARENEREIELLKAEIETLKTKESYFINKQSNIKRVLDGFIQERQEYQSKKDQQNSIINELARDKAIYKKRFDTIRSSRRALQKKLAQLKIIKQDQESEQRAKEEAKQSVKQEERRYASASSPKESTYSGGKTISPLPGSKLIKKFGSYMDPIYKFKVFNKSITLKSPYKGAKVKSVLGGKVVFAEDSGGMLGKVVIIEHPNKLHTIYAKLSRLAPSVHVGKRVSKGSIIGKVNSTLMFEVTKNNRHMNPLKLIRL